MVGGVTADASSLAARSRRRLYGTLARPVPRRGRSAADRDRGPGG